MEKLKKNSSILFKILSWSVPLIISIVSLCISTITSCNMQKENINLQKELATQREEFEIDLKMQDAIPHLRLSTNKSAYATMNIFDPDRELKIIKLENGLYSSESYMTISGFYFENIGDNIAFFSHIEYGGVAYELKELNLCVKNEEVVYFSSENKFIYLNFTNKMTIVIKTLYGQYFSYECILNSGIKTDNTRCCTVEQIGEPKPYNIENEVYKNMEIHVRDIYTEVDNIIFGIE